MHPPTRAPKQDRSIRRVQKLLTATADLIVESGVNGFALSTVAKRAGTAQGSLYQFFTSREALIGQLHAGFAADLKQIADNALESFRVSPEPLTTKTLVDAILPPMADFYRRNPAYTELRHAQAAGQGPAKIEEGIDRHIKSVLTQMTALAYPRLEAPLLQVAADLILAVGDTILAGSGNKPGQAQDSLWLTEGRTMLVAYLDSLPARSFVDQG